MAEAIVARSLQVPGAHALSVTDSTRCWSFFHEAYCVTVVSAGFGRWRYRQRDAEIKPGSLMLMEPGEVHATTSVERAGDFHALFFDAALVREVLAAAGARDPHLKLLGTEQREVVQGFETLCSMLDAERDAEAQRQQLSLCLTQLFDHASESGTLSLAVPTTRVRKAARVLREMYESTPWQTVNVAGVAREVGMSYHWLVHSFARHFGMPPYQYVQALRLAKVRSLLQRGPRVGLRSLSDIASAVGFNDKSHLHRSVKQHYGISPWKLALQLNPSWSVAAGTGV